MDKRREPSWGHLERKSILNVLFMTQFELTTWINNFELTFCINASNSVNPKWNSYICQYVTWINVLIQTSVICINLQSPPYKGGVVNSNQVNSFIKTTNHERSNDDGTTERKRSGASLRERESSD